MNITQREGRGQEESGVRRNTYYLQKKTSGCGPEVFIE
jgi:hypothetical protein